VGALEDFARPRPAPLAEVSEVPPPAGPRWDGQ